MPRRYYRRRPIVVRPKKKWASNLITLSFPIESSDNIPGRTLVQNSTQSSTPTPTIIKVGNFKVAVDVSYTFAAAPSILPNCTLYVIFLPEGISIGSNAELGGLVTAHPEYVLAWKRLDFDYATSSGTYNSRSISVSSRLKRNLNSGDKIFLGLYTGTTGTTASIALVGTCQFWTCAN